LLEKYKMDSYRKMARLAGILIIVGMIAGILSVVPSVESSNYLTEVSANQYQVLIGAFFQLTLVPIYIGFALLLFPLLRRYSESLAIGFVSFRIIAGIFQLIGVIVLPLFLFFSQEYLKSSISDMVHFQILGDVLKLVRDLVNHVGMMLATGLSNLILSYMFYKTRLVPRWLSIWGFIGNSLAMLASILILFQFIDVIAPNSIVLTIPLVLQEFALAIVLIAKGFNTSAIDNRTHSV